MFMEPKIAKHMRWHKEGKRVNPSVMVHPSDSETWINFSIACPDFAMGPRNVRIAIATDGFNPFSFGKTLFLLASFCDSFKLISSSLYERRKYLS
jgi:hypothetical protein